MPRHVDLAVEQEKLNAMPGGDKYKIEKVLGQGAYGVVMLAHDLAASQASGKPARVALKRILPEILNDTDLLPRIYREITILAHFQHENIIGLLDVLLPEDTPPGGAEDPLSGVYLVMEVLDMDLKMMMASRQHYSEPHIQYFMYQVLVALNTLHNANVLHRDLAPANILLTTDCDVKVCDFGLAREIPDGSSGEELSVYVVTRWYRAPELIMGTSDYDGQIDVWSVGCIFAQMYNGGTPMFKGNSEHDQMEKILSVMGVPSDASIEGVGTRGNQNWLRKQPKNPPTLDFEKLFHLPGEDNPVSPDAIDLAKKLLAFNPKERISVTQAMEHPYFSTLFEEKDLQAVPHPPYTPVMPDGPLAIGPLKEFIKQHLKEAMRVRKERQAEKEKKEREEREQMDDDAFQPCPSGSMDYSAGGSPVRTPATPLQSPAVNAFPSRTAFFDPDQEAGPFGKTGGNNFCRASSSWTSEDEEQGNEPLTGSGSMMVDE